jgi:hypothetical protein
VLKFFTGRRGKNLNHTRNHSSNNLLMAVIFSMSGAVHNSYFSAISFGDKEKATSILCEGVFHCFFMLSEY